MNYYDILLAKKLNGGGGGEATLIDKSISSNGTYNASSDNADGYKKVVVNVPNPSTGSLSITSNNTYDVTNYASAVVNVPADKTGTFTPSEDITSQTIDTGLSTITGLLIYPDSNPNVSSGYITHTILILPNGSFAKFFGAYTMNNGGTKTWLQYVSDTPPYTINGGSITINVPGHIFKSGVAYSWRAW